MGDAPVIWADSFGSEDETVYTVRGGSIVSGVGRGGRNAYNLSNGQALTFVDVSTHKLWIVSFGLKVVTGVGTNERIPTLGNVAFHRDPTDLTLVATGFGSTSKAIPASTWIHVALRVYFDASAGTVDMWFDETNVLSLTAKNTGSAPQSVTFTTSTGNTFQICDLVIQASDTSGDTPLGDRAVSWLPPTSDGADTDWTPLTGTDHFAMVDESPPDGDTSYNSSSTATDKDSYGMTDLAASVASVDAVVWKGSFEKTDAGTRAVKPLLVISSTEYEGTAQNLGTSYQQLYQVYNTSPATSSAFTVSEVNALEAGVELSS